jgi:hypothetical protein
MNPSRLTIPPPQDDDHEDVAWALRAASAQWKRDSRDDAVAWVKRAAETADEVGQRGRAEELKNLAAALSGSPRSMAPKAMAPPPPRPGVAVAPPPPRAPQPSLGVVVDVELDDVEEVDEVDELLEDDIQFEEAEESTAATSYGVGSTAPAPPGDEPVTEDVITRDKARGLADIFPHVLEPPAPAVEERRDNQFGIDLEDDPSFGDRVSAPEVAYGETSLDDLGLGDLGQLEDAHHAGLAEADELESPFSEEHTTDRPADEFSEEEPPTAQMAPPASEPPPASFAGPPSEPPAPFSAPAPSASFPSAPFPPSGPPAEPFALAPSALAPDVAELEAAAEAAGGITAPAGAPTDVDGVPLENVSGLADLPEDSQADLARGAELVALSAGEEARSFAVALVTAGAVDIMPAIADAACARARRGEVIFTRGTLGDGVALRVVGAENDTRVAIWSAEQLTAATAACPWVADELALVADRFQALAGAVQGPLGDSLDDMFRPMVLEKCTVRRFGPGDVLLEKGKAVDGMYIVGAGWVELANEDGSVAEELGPGDFLFKNTILMPGKATRTARAGQGGALMLFAPRMATHELLATCPPFIELVAG